ncbi:LysE family translocator [Arthrobacter sp. Sa2BUA2]|uniref:LysE family translocator n=1 Tax=Arthrobacter pullicola TaxID=2762224 RepID=A0ABR8YM89_9MICC|nr:LysE family translocator [Arthrobacter pullicola]MBD8045191.1 LysE family translocator [Arthrobacter pullicola]
MTIEQALLGFTAVAILLTIMPGLDSAMVLRSAISQGPRHAVATGLGINTGAFLWGAAAAVGISALLTASETAYTALKLAGAAYMLWLGGSLLWKSFRRRQAAVEVDGALPASGERLVTSWAKGLGTNLLNPKVGVFYIAMIPQFIPEGASPLLMGLALAGIHNLLSVAWFGFIIGAAHLARKTLQAPRSVRLTDRLTGVALLGFGTSLAVRH